MKTTTTLTIAMLLFALPLTGCIENMRDLKDRFGATSDELDQASAEMQEALNETERALNETDNATKERAKKAPVARASLFAAGGALVYQSTFVGEDVAEPIRVDQGDPITANGADSEALEAGAEIAEYAWIYGTQTLTGRQVEILPDIAGLQTLTLRVTDSNGKTDTQTLTLAVAPKPFTLTTEFTTGPVAGGVGAGQAASGTFEVLAEHEGNVVRVQGGQVVATPGPECDAGLTVYDPEGNVIGDADSAGNGGAETVGLGALAAGTYTAEAWPFACAAPNGVHILVSITYVPIVEGLGDDGHAHHH